MEDIGGALTVVLEGGWAYICIGAPAWSVVVIVCFCRFFRFSVFFQSFDFRTFFCFWLSFVCLCFGGCVFCAQFKVLSCLVFLLLLFFWLGFFQILNWIFLICCCWRVFGAQWFLNVVALWMKFLFFSILVFLVFQFLCVQFFCCFLSALFGFEIGNNFLFCFLKMFFAIIFLNDFVAVFWLSFHWLRFWGLLLCYFFVAIFLFSPSMELSGNSIDIATALSSIE